MTADRVETRVRLIGRGNSVSPESIDELQKRARQVERLAQGKPQTSFSEVLGRGARAPDREADDGEEESTLPKKGPRPGLVHPTQRQVYGRGDKETVVLKG